VTSCAAAGCANATTNTAAMHRTIIGSLD